MKNVITSKIKTLKQFNSIALLTKKESASLKGGQDIVIADIIGG